MANEIDAKDGSGVLEIRRLNEISEFPLSQPVISIGRSADNQVVLSDEAISQYHARLEWAKGVLYLTDLGSTSGTLLNSAKIEPGKAVPVKGGDIISIGGFTLVTRLPDAAEKAPVSKGKKQIVADAKAEAAAVTKKGGRRWVKLVAIVGGVVVLVGAAFAAFVMLSGAKVAVSLPVLTSSSDIDNTRDEVIFGLKEMNEAATDKIDSEMDNIGQELNKAKTEVAKLKQVADPAFEWLELQMTRGFQKGGSWQATMHPQWLRDLKNDRYQLTRLEFMVRDAGTEKQQFLSMAVVMDLATNTEYNCVALDSQLREQVAAIEQQWQAQQQKRQLAVAALASAIAGSDKWEIKAVDKNSYSISGSGLGMTEAEGGSGFLEVMERITAGTAGKWTYHADSGEMEPADSPSQALQKILSGEF